MRPSTIVQALIAISVTILLSGCMTADEHYRKTHGAQERQMTVGAVQKEIRKGMSAAEVAEVLGSPNIITTDCKGREVWVYDKISTDVTYSRNTGGADVGLLTGGQEVALLEGVWPVVAIPDLLGLNPKHNGLQLW